MVGNCDLTRLINPTKLDSIGNSSSKLSGQCPLGVATMFFSPENPRGFNLRKKPGASFFFCVPYTLIGHFPCARTRSRDP
jgi:hypothetical protein